MTEEITDSSGNVFADLGLEDAEDLSLKAALAIQVASIIKHRHLTQRDAGELLGIPQSHVSRIMNGKLEGITSDRILRMLLKLGRDIDIVIKKKSPKVDQGRLSIATAKKRVPVAA
ncbi:putative XRE-type DNA-binding protein [Rhodovulum bhavnagarense]|uniref:Putative XRE-type DNA-binding protein n=1 Tax=Rhodovulum bhavnagarense TaxID=992286 RepID=A0A4R2RFQ2_9RHOB|nr:helix-turn-helix transcriptional regulator [Rhodovulum bhavnagarense]TCP58461.1 putative XRE-type DNA-binding protein [Rhodovulum bhavnagarense]